MLPMSYAQTTAAVNGDVDSTGTLAANAVYVMRPLSPSTAVPTAFASSSCTSGAAAMLIEDSTRAFRRTIELNNVGAMIMQRGDYVASIKALTASFLSFKKTYGKQKCRTICLRRVLMNEAIDAIGDSSNDSGESSTTACAIQSFIYDVDELFTWRKTGRGAAADTHIVSESSGVSFSTINSLERRRQERSKPVASSATETTTAAAGCFDDDDYYVDQEGVSMYSNPLFLPPDFPITQESCGFLSTTITLNLAIANHLYGLELQQQKAPPSMIEQHLMGAGRYYEYTIRLERARQQEEQRRMCQISSTLVTAAAAALARPQNSNSNTTSQHHRRLLSVSSLPAFFISPLALLVILNNLGHLHLALSNKDRSQRCYRQLQSMLMFLLIHKSRNASLSLSNKLGDLSIFMENATLGLESTNTRPTAAAA